MHGYAQLCFRWQRCITATIGRWLLLLLRWHDWITNWIISVCWRCTCIYRHHTHQAIDMHNANETSLLCAQTLHQFSRLKISKV